MTVARAPFDVLTNFTGHEVVVRPHGDIDLATGPDLQAVLDAVVRRARPLVILDLADVGFMDATGLQLISGLANELEASGSALVVRSPSELTHRVLNILGFGALVEARHTPHATGAPVATQWTGAGAPVIRSLDEVRASSSRARERTVDAALGLVVAVTTATMSSGGSVSVTLSRRGRLTTAVASDDAAAALDEVQCAAGQGPCVDAAATGLQQRVASTTDDIRWRDVLAHAAEAGITTIVSSPLTVGGDPFGALNIYGRNEPFGTDTHELAQLIARHAAAILADEGDDSTAAEDVRRLQEALRFRELIAQAQGVLMERDGIGADAAVDYLRRRSRQVDVTLRALARDTIASASAPSDPRVGG